MNVVTSRRSCVRGSSWWVIALSLSSPACVSIYLGDEPVAEVTTPPDREEDDTAVSSPTPILEPTPTPEPTPTLEPTPTVTPTPGPTPTPTAVPVVDADGDGVDASLDCNDADPSVAPGFPELCNDSIDSNCDGEPSDGCPACNVEALQASLTLYVDGEEVRAGESIDPRVPILFRTSLKNTCTVDAILESDTICFAEMKIYESFTGAQLWEYHRDESSDAIASFQDDCSELDSVAIIPPGRSIAVEWLWFQMDDNGVFVKPATGYYVEAEWVSNQEVVRTFSLNNCASPTTFCAQ